MIARAWTFPACPDPFPVNHRDSFEVYFDVTYKLQAVDWKSKLKNSNLDYEHNNWICVNKSEQNVFGYLTSVTTLIRSWVENAFVDKSASAAGELLFRQSRQYIRTCISTWPPNPILNDWSRVQTGGEAGTMPGQAAFLHVALLGALRSKSEVTLGGYFNPFRMTRILFV